MIPKPNMANIAKAEDQTTAAVTEILKGPMWMIEQILRKHETAVIEVMREQQQHLDATIDILEQTRTQLATHQEALKIAKEALERFPHNIFAKEALTKIEELTK